MNRTLPFQRAIKDIISGCNLWMQFFKPQNKHKYKGKGAFFPFK